MTSTGRTIDEARERRLIDGLRNNDRGSLEEVYDEYSGAAYALALRVLGIAGEAEDVVQESFLALWRQATRLDPGRGIRSYLYTIVHNKAIDRLRQRGRKGELPLDLDAPLATSDAGPEETVTQVEERASVRAALLALPEEQRRTVLMTYYGGMTINAVASRMGVPAGTVKSRLRLALGHMRRSLDEGRP
jgi:RNA polymerase sigma-70 factor (ECF subfamily)